MRCSGGGAVQQHTVVLELIPVPGLCGILGPAQPQAQPGTGCHMQGLVSLLLSPGSQPAAPVQHMQGPRCNNLSCRTCVCVSCPIYPPPPLAHGNGVSLRVRARVRARNMGNLQAKAPQQPNPPSPMHSLSHGARALCPPQKEGERQEAGGTLCPQEGSSCRILCTGT